jgi:hypothetical protein
MNQSEFMTSLHGLLKLQSVETRIPTYMPTVSQKCFHAFETVQKYFLSDCKKKC